jgi:hypothetical protein
MKCLRHGGDVLSIERIGHSTFEKVAEWFYVCTVKWPDTGKVSHEVHVTPSEDGTAEGEAEWHEASAKLNAYLARAGRWHEGKWVGDYLVNWTPKQPKGAAPFESIVVEKEAA